MAQPGVLMKVGGLLVKTLAKPALEIDPLSGAPFAQFGDEEDDRTDQEMVSAELCE